MRYCYYYCRVQNNGKRKTTDVVIVVVELLYTAKEERLLSYDRLTPTTIVVRFSSPTKPAENNLDWSPRLLPYT